MPWKAKQNEEREKMRCLSQTNNKQWKHPPHKNSQKLRGGGAVSTPILFVSPIFTSLMSAKGKSKRKQLWVGGAISYIIALPCISILASFLNLKIPLHRSPTSQRIKLFSNLFHVKQSYNHLETTFLLIYRIYFFAIFFLVDQIAIINKAGFWSWYQDI